MTRLLLPLLLLSGCYVGKVFELAEPDERACAFTVVDTSGDLALKVDAGRGDGTFDHSIEGWSALVNTVGQYDLDLGTFWWENHWATGGWRTRDRAEGAGVIFTNGDLDLDYDLTHTFGDQTERTFDVRHERTGCTEVLRVQAQDDQQLRIYDSVWLETGLDYTRQFIEGPAAMTAQGHLNRNRTWTEIGSYDDGTVVVDWFTEGDGNGHHTRVFDDNNGWDKLIGTWDRFRDGTVVMDYTQNNPGTEKQTWSFQVDSAITGTGTWSRGDDTCDLIFTEGNCKLRNCSDPDLESKCTVEVSWPDF